MKAIHLKSKYAGVIATVTFLWLGCLILLASRTACAFTQVTLSAGTNESVERAFLQATTSYFDGVLVANPLVPNTWTFKLKGIKSLPPVVNPVDATKVINDFIANSTYTYAYGWANGVSYERFQDLGYISQAYQLTTSTDDCKRELSTLSQFIYQLNFATPTVLTGF